MYSQFHQEFAKVDPRRDRNVALSAPARRAQPPPGRLRGRAAHALVYAALRLDGERARRAIA
jgi:hypothetical protein